MKNSHIHNNLRNLHKFSEPIIKPYLHSIMVMLKTIVTQFRRLYYVCCEIQENHENCLSVKIARPHLTLSFMKKTINYTFAYSQEVPEFKSPITQFLYCSRTRTLLWIRYNMENHTVLLTLLEGVFQLLTSSNSIAKITFKHPQANHRFLFIAIA